MMKLMHCPEFSNKVTSDMEDNKWNEPILGRGRYRQEGQKILKRGVSLHSNM